MIRRFLLAWPYFLVWRMWKWHRDYHEARHIDGPISQDLVNAQNEEYEARMRLQNLMEGTPWLQL